MLINFVDATNDANHYTKPSLVVTRAPVRGVVLVVVKEVYEFHFARYYGNHMVLQRAPSRAVIWGYGPVISDNTSVVVTVDNNSTHRSVYHTIVKYTGHCFFLEAFWGWGRENSPNFRKSPSL